MSAFSLPDPLAYYNAEKENKSNHSSPNKRSLRRELSNGSSSALSSMFESVADRDSTFLPSLQNVSASHYSRLSDFSIIRPESSYHSVSSPRSTASVGNLASAVNGLRVTSSAELEGLEAEVIRGSVSPFQQWEMRMNPDQGSDDVSNLCTSHTLSISGRYRILATLVWIRTRQWTMDLMIRQEQILIRGIWQTKRMKRLPNGRPPTTISIPHLIGLSRPNLLVCVLQQKSFQLVLKLSIFILAFSHFVKPLSENSQILGQALDPEDMVEIIQQAPLSDIDVEPLFALTRNTPPTYQVLLKIAPTLIAPTLISLASLLFFYWMNRSSPEHRRVLKKTSSILKSCKLESGTSSEHHIFILGARGAGKTSIFHRQIFNTIEVDQSKTSKSRRITYTKNGQVIGTTLHDTLPEKLSEARVVVGVFSLEDRVCVFFAPAQR